MIRTLISAGRIFSAIFSMVAVLLYSLQFTISYKSTSLYIAMSEPGGLFLSNSIDWETASIGIKLSLEMKIYIGVLEKRTSR